MPKPKNTPSLYQLKLTLVGIDPPIWRRIQVPSTLPLCCIHDAFQIVMGWTDSHLHQFEKDGVLWGIPDDDAVEGDPDIIEESRVALRDVLKAEGESIVYLYDFGDKWRHAVVLEKIVPVENAQKPVCLAGERRCPPEDVGGPSGYAEFLEAVFNPTHEEFDHYRQWAGDPVHAEEFDVAGVNEALSKKRWPVRHRR